MADKKGRIQEVIQRNVSEIILYQLKNDVCKFASVHKVDLAPDYSTCKIYVSHIQKDSEHKLVNYLNDNANLIRSLLSKTLDIYKTPSLSFYLVTDEIKNSKIEDIINKIKNTKKKTIKDL